MGSKRARADNSDPRFCLGRITAVRATEKKMLSNRTTCELLFIPMGDDGGDRRLLL